MTKATTKAPAKATRPARRTRPAPIEPDPDPDPLRDVGDLSTPLPRHESAPAPAAAPDGKLQVHPRPAPSPPEDADLERLVRAAERSGDAHALAAAARLRSLADDLSARLGLLADVQLAHQRISTLHNEVQSLRQLVERRDTRRAPAKRPAAERRAPARAPRPAPAESAATASPRSGPTPRARGPRDEIRYAPAVRDWARRNGVAVGGRGRIPQNVIEAYLRAHPAGA